MTDFPLSGAGSSLSSVALCPGRLSRPDATIIGAKIESLFKRRDESAVNASSSTPRRNVSLATQTPVVAELSRGGDAAVTER
jgi:hypothetical protein